jgi:hypothetical protein
MTAGTMRIGFNGGGLTRSLSAICAEARDAYGVLIHGTDRQLMFW